MWGITMYDIEKIAFFTNITTENKNQSTNTTVGVQLINFTEANIILCYYTPLLNSYSSVAISYYLQQFDNNK